MVDEPFFHLAEESKESCHENLYHCRFIYKPRPNDIDLLNAFAETQYGARQETDES